MSAFHNNMLLGSVKTADLGDPIEQSLRFRGTQYLKGSTYPSGADFTVSMWFKYDLSASNYPSLFGSTTAGYGIGLNLNQFGGVAPSQWYLSGEYLRDPSAWYHLVYNNNGIWLNGEQVSVTSWPGFGTTLSAHNFVIGDIYEVTGPPPDDQYKWTGYIADAYLVDGSNLAPTTFGRYNADGVWVPKTPTISSYGTKGFHLTFDPTQSNGIGHDSSGQGNHFTANYFTTTAGPSNDVVSDTPTSNFATLNSIYPVSTGSPNSANLSITSGASYISLPGTIAMDGDGKYYVEADIDNSPINPPNRQYGIVLTPASGWNGTDSYLSTNTYIIWLLGGSTSSEWKIELSVNNSATVSSGVLTSPSPPAANSKIQIAYDANTRKLYMGVNNNNWLDSGGILNATFDVTKHVAQLTDVEGGYTVGALVYNGTISLNNGQQPFEYTPPTDFKALQTANLDEPTIPDGSDHFQAITGPGAGGGTLYTDSVTDPGSATLSLGTLTQPTYSGSSTSTPYSGNAFSYVWDAGGEITGSVTLNFAFQPGTQTYASSLDGQTWFNVFTDNGTAITINPGQPYRYVRKYSSTAGAQNFNTTGGPPILQLAQATFPSGLWWIKDRVNTNNHQLVDSVRGVNQAVILPGSALGEIAYVQPSGDSVAWCWSVDGPASANNDGSIETQVAVNEKAGFSIITYTGDGGAASTIGHGLGAVPEFYGVWCRTAGQSLLATVRHQDLTSANKVLYLTAANAETDYAVFGGVLPTDSVITVQGNLANNTNGNNLDFVMYAWTSIPGYSAFGSYVANNSTDGPFIYTGFKPAFVMTKITNTTGDWQIRDNARSPYNPAINTLYPNLSNAEYTGANADVDILSNGFKIRNTDINLSDNTYIYAAFAENPFGGENTAPATAR